MEKDNKDMFDTQEVVINPTEADEYGDGFVLNEDIDNREQDKENSYGDKVQQKSKQKIIIICTVIAFSVILIAVIMGFAFCSSGNETQEETEPATTQSTQETQTHTQGSTQAPVKETQEATQKPTEKVTDATKATEQQVVTEEVTEAPTVPVTEPSTEIITEEVVTQENTDETIA